MSAAGPLIVMSYIAQFVLGAKMALLRRVFTPTVAGTVLMLIPVSVVPIIGLAAGAVAGLGFGIYDLAIAKMFVAGFPQPDRDSIHGALRAFDVDVNHVLRRHVRD